MRLEEIARALVAEGKGILAWHDSCHLSEIVAAVVMALAAIASIVGCVVAIITAINRKAWPLIESARRRSSIPRSLRRSASISSSGSHVVMALAAVASIVGCVVAIITAINRKPRE